jgi:hypothetical protein
MDMERECTCIETRITYRKDGETGTAPVRIRCAAREHAPRFELPVQCLRLPVGEVSA